MRHLLLFSMISLSVEVAWLKISARNVSCERAEAVNAAYMKGFQAGKTEGIRVAVETVKAQRISTNMIGKK